MPRASARATQQTDEVKAAMMRFEYFHPWSDATIVKCCTMAKIKTYDTNRTILGDGFGLPNSVYFVLKGQCKILEELYVRPYLVNNEKRYKLYKPGFHDAIKETIVGERGKSEMTVNEKEIEVIPSSVEMHIMQVCILNPLSCFGFGEYMERRSVIATTTTECLLIPRYWLMQQSMNNIWNRIKIFLFKHIPTTEQVFSEFVSERRWFNHSRKLTEEIIANRKSTSNNILCDVPYFLRINENTETY